MPKLSERGVVHLLLPLILVLGLIAGVYLVTSSNPLKLFSRAAAPISGPVSPYVCGVYFRQTSSSKMIQGSYTNDPQATSSMKACYEYLKNNIFNKPNCAQPNGEYATGVLMLKSKFTFDMPSINMSTEFVANQNCSKPTPTPLPTPTPRAAWTSCINTDLSRTCDDVCHELGKQEAVYACSWEVEGQGWVVDECLRAFSDSNCSTTPRIGLCGTDTFNRIQSQISTYGMSGECCCSYNPTPTPTAVSCSACGANVRGDGKVSITDMMIVARCMGTGPTGSVGKYSCQKADMNGDNKINASDLNCVREQFGKQCAPPPPPPPPRF